MSVPCTPLDAWLIAKLGLQPGHPPDRAALADYYLAQLRKTVSHTRKHSPFYRKRLAGLPLGFPKELDECARLPFTTVEDLRHHHQAMLCVSQGRVARVVTLATSGTTAPPKRLFFSDEDLGLTLDFFHHGMSTMVEPGDRVLILLPGATPNSVGDLLARALARMEVRGVVHGPAHDPGQALRRAADLGVDCLVGIPVQVLAMAMHPVGESLAGLVKSVLLTTDYVPRALTRRIEEAWGCEVFQHYGMTETGLGGGVDCRAHKGYHLRAADLYYEVVDPAGGEPLPLGQEGELVVSTLTRHAMPLLRYRTGDRGRLLPGVCGCGGFTPRLEKVPGRLDNLLDLGGGCRLPMCGLDEALFDLPELLDYRVCLSGEGRRRRLEVQVQAVCGPDKRLAAKVRGALLRIPELAARLATDDLVFKDIKFSDEAWAVDGSSKRTFRQRDF